MTILGIETSCDETGAAVVEKDSQGNLTILSNALASSLLLHAKTGGIIPESAAREQLLYILPVITDAVKNIGWEKIDAIGITNGPGLIGSLLVGVETAKTIAYVLKKPIIPVNHLYGHIYANWLMANSKWQIEEENKEPYAISHKPYAEIAFPALALVVSGGHTDLVIMQNHGQMEVIGGTRDDAAGEAFDKIGRLLGLPYPAGPAIAQLAEKGNPQAFTLPRPLIGSGDFDFSFSGLKTAALREVKNNVILNPDLIGGTDAKNLSHVISNPDLSGREISGGSLTNARDDNTLANFCASVQHAIVDVLVKKTIKAAEFYNVKSILLGGGVSANEKLREQLKLSALRVLPSVKVFVPQKSLCTDNAAMIAAAAFFAKPTPWQEILANPELYY